ncbi:hypothetical protein [Mariprofundus ferrooxydans]|nr:hypothetical protein [Mariprofundus ferrooxydans]
MFTHTKKKSLLQGNELTKRAEELGVSLIELYDVHGVRSEPELQRRVIEAERAERESRLWLIAVISSVASVFSAIAACIAVATMK